MAPESEALEAAWRGDDSRSARLFVGAVVAVCLHVALLWIRLGPAQRGPGPGRVGTAIEVSLVATASPPQQVSVVPPAPALPASAPRVKPAPERPAPRAKAPERPVHEETAVAPVAERLPAEPVEPAVASPVPAPLPGATVVGEPADQAARTPASEGLISARPRYKTNPKPRYPPIARRRRQEGVVLLSVFVDASGKPVSIEIEGSSGVEALDKAAVEAVGGWEFEPGVRDGEAVPSRVEVPIRFELE